MTTETRHATPDEKAVLCKAIERVDVNLYGERMRGGYITNLFKELLTTTGGTSNQGVNPGEKLHPFDFSRVRMLQMRNEHHSTCIRTKTAATVGLGCLSPEERATREKIASGEATTERISGSWKFSKVDEVLNPLCDHSWQDVLNDACEDYWQVGNGFVEVVRDDSGTVTGLHHCPADQVIIVVEDDLYNRHFKMRGGEGATWDRKFAAFGDLDDFKQRHGLKPEDRVGEIIHIRQPSSLNRWYGVPDWISAVAAIELIACLRQHKYDFFNNRGVPEFFLWVKGAKLDDASWKAIVEAINATVGMGNGHKSVAVNIPSPDVEIQIDKLAMDGKAEDSLEGTNETYQLAIVSAHRVPPLLAGIQIPGKLAANNELPNALRSFQALCIGQAQRIWQQRLGSTLGNKTINGGLGLTMDDFTFRTITDEINLDVMDTSAKMRQPEAQARAQGRDMTAGVKK